jgi:Fur family ferric uptake transcriptional regulator
MIRNTRQRTIIRDVFKTINRPLGAQEVLNAAQSQYPALGIATVYRTIKSLTEEGWLVPVDVPGEPPRYELSGKAHHHHFHCRDCGRMFELEGCVDNIKSLAPPGFRVSGHEVVLFGFCLECAAVKRPGARTLVSKS